MEPSVRFRDEVLSVVTWDRMFFNRWYGPVTKRHVGVLREQQRVHCDEVGRHVVVSHVETRTGLAIEDGAREMAVDLVKEFQTDVVCLGQVAAGRGFHSSAVRAVLAGVHLVGRGSYPKSVFATVEECARWVAKHWKLEFPDADTSQIVSQIESVPQMAIAHAS